MEMTVMNFRALFLAKPVIGERLTVGRREFEIKSISSDGDIEFEETFFM